MQSEGNVRICSGFVLALVATAVAPRTLVAQDLESSRVAADSRTNAAVIAEVLVTARRREEVAHEVPVSLSVRVGNELERAHALRLQELAQTVPNLFTEILNPRQASIAIRGLGRNPANDGLESSVGVFVDGVYLGRPGMAVTDYVDVERIEVLRGPQGTLFGKNTTAGLLNVVTRAPSAKFETFAQATMGNQSYMQMHGAISGPLTDDLNGRFSAFTTSRDGFVTNTPSNRDLGEFDRNAARAQLAWQPSDAFDLRLSADYSDQDELGAGLVLVDSGIRMEDGSIRPNNFLDRTARAGHTPTFEPFARRNHANSAQRIKTENSGVSAHARWQLGSHTLTSITAWRMWNFRPRTDGDLSPLNVQPQLHFEVADEQASTELRLASDGGGRFDYQLGAFLFGQNLASQFVTSFGEHGADFAQPSLPSAALDGFEVRTRGTPRTRSAALFAQSSVNLTERLSVTAGLRWTTENKEAVIRRTSSGGGALAADDSASRAWRDRLGSPVSVMPKIDEDFTSSLLSIAYRTENDALAYLQASRGAKSGGINIAIVPSGLSQVIDREVVTSFELGFKKRWDMFGLDLTLFDMSVDGYQATVRDPTRGATFLANAGDVRTQGVELEMWYQPRKDLRLTLAGGSADARFTSFRRAPCPPETVGRTTCDFTGSRVPGAPPWSLNLGAHYDMALGQSGHDAFIAADWFHAGAYRVELSSYTSMQSYDVLNARVGVRSASRRWEAWMWARNLLDEAYYTSLGAGGPFNVGLVYGLVADARTYGVSLRLSY